MIELRPYQNEIVESIRQAYRQGFKCPLLRLDTGGGKTIIFSFIVHQSVSRGGYPWVMAHRRELIAQISQSLALFGVKHRICADASTVRKMRIKHFKTFGKSFVDQTASALVGSVQTVASMLKNPNVKPPSIIIMDEAHHVIEGNQWGNVFDRFPDSLKLKVTATPERTDGRGLGAGHGGYADTIIHGPSMPWLIENGYLSRYEVYGSDNAISTDDVHVKKSEFDQNELDAAAGSKTVVGDAIAHYRKLAMGMRAVAFCVSIKRSKELADAFNADGIPAVHVDGEMEDDDREKAIADYADGKYMVLCNQSLVSEGFDLASIAQKPVTIDCVIDLAPTMSVIKFMQSWGRALRPAPGKVAIILDHANNWKRHGFPHFSREWSLEGREKGKRRKAADMEADVLVRKCPKCGAIHEPEPTCPNCFFVYPKQDREVKEIDGELGRIDPKEAERQQRIAARIEQGKAQTVDDMVSQLGYSRSRAERVAAAREAKQRQIAECLELIDEYTRNTGLSCWRGLGINKGDVRKMKPKQLAELAANLRGKLDVAEPGDSHSESLLADCW